MVGTGIDTDADAATLPVHVPGPLLFARIAPGTLGQPGDVALPPVPQRWRRCPSARAAHCWSANR